MRRWVALAVAATAATAAAGLPHASAAGDMTVVVRGLDLPAGAKSELTAVGCSDVFTRSGQAVTPMIGAMPGRAANRRSLAFDPDGGDAIGPVSYVDQVAATTVAGMDVYAELGATGVAYVGYQPPADAEGSTMWIGRTDLAVPADQWTAVDARSGAPTWTQYDMSTQQATGATAGPTPLADFVAAHGGDGYGFYAFGFGCDGHEFNMDMWRIGQPGATTTYDFEGYRAEVAAPRVVEAPAGNSVELTAHITDDQGQPLAAVARLEEKVDGDWVAVVDKDGHDVERTGPDVSASVTVGTDKATYRWSVYGTGLTAGGSALIELQDKNPEPTDKPAARDSEQSAPAEKQSKPAHTTAQAKQSAGVDEQPDPAPASPDPTSSATPSPSQPAEVSAD